MRKADHVTDIQERTHEQTFQDTSLAREQKIASHKNDTVNGIKGLSASFGPLGYDVIKGTSIDYMHTVLLITVKMFMSH